MTCKRTLVALAAGAALAFAGAHGALAAAATPAAATPAAATPLEVLHVQGAVYAVFGAGGNIVISVGKDGVFMVDTGLAQNAERVLEAVRRVQAEVQSKEPPPARVYAAETRGTLQLSMNPLGPPKPIRFIVNTHAHPDHVGGNEVVRKAGKTFTGGNVANDIADAASGAMIFAHENTANRMREVPAGQAPPSDSAVPSDLYTGPQMKFSHFFNGEGIQFFHPRNAHTDGDTYVVFRDSDVIATGDLFVMTTYPFIDQARGGTINGLIDAANDILDRTVPEYRSEGGTLIVPGHGRIGDIADLAYYRDMITTIRDRVADLKGKGRTLEQVKAAKVTFDYDPRFNAPTGLGTADNFVEAVYKTLPAPATARRARPASR